MFNIDPTCANLSLSHSIKLVFYPTRLCSNTSLLNTSRVSLGIPYDYTQVQDYFRILCQSIQHDYVQVKDYLRTFQHDYVYVQDYLTTKY